MAGTTDFPARQIAAAAALAVCGFIASTAAAQGRSPAYAAARASGEVGERVDGYLGVVRGASPEIKELVDDINIRRRAIYTDRAQAQHATVEEYAMAQACILIWRTAPGERYQAPDGTWRTRTEAPPVRDPRCP